MDLTLYNPFAENNSKSILNGEFYFDNDLELHITTFIGLTTLSQSFTFIFNLSAFALGYACS